MAKRKNPSLRRSQREEPAVVEDLIWTRNVDSDGDVYWSRFVQLANSPDCPACVAGTCVQKLVKSSVLENDVLVHDCRNELS